MRKKKLRTAARLCLQTQDASDDYRFAPEQFELVPLSNREEPLRVRRGDIPGLLEGPLFLSGLREWNRYRRFGLPHGRGYLGEKRLYVLVVEIFEQEHNAFLYDKTRS